MSKKKQIKKTIPRRIIEVIGYTVMAIIIAVLLFVVVSKITNHTVFLFGKTTAWVMTESMEPQIPARSYILVRRVEPSEIQVGDVIMFKSDDPGIKGSYNTHRVVDILGDGEEFITKGDANLAQDEYTAKAGNIVGIYERNLPVMTAVGRFLFSGIGIIITVTALLAITMMIYIPDIVKANKLRTEEIEQKRREQIEELIREEVNRLRSENAKIDKDENTSSDDNDSDPDEKIT